MKMFISLFILCFSVNIFAQELNCQYKNHDNKNGNTSITIDEDNFSIQMVFKNITVSANNCKMTIKPDEVTVECDEAGNSIGVILELLNGKLEGVLISEKAGVFGEAKC